MPVKQEHVNIINSLGYTLAGALLSPSDPPQHPAGVVLIHGLLKNKKHFLMKRAGDVLVKSGFFVLKADLTGHGKSDGGLTEATLTRWTSDIGSLIDFFYSQGIRRIGLLGYSLGGTSSLLRASIDPRVNALVLFAPIGHPARLKRRFNKELANRMLEMNRLYLKKGAVFDDQGFQSWLTDMQSHDAVEASRQVHQPALIVHGSLDIVAPVEESLDILSSLGTDESNKKRIVYKTAAHGFIGYASKLSRLANDWFIKYLPYESKAVRIWLRHHNKYLIVRRSRRMKFFPGMWSPIGGFIENGSSPKEQALTEIKEEVGLSKSQVKIINISNYPIRFADSKSDKLWEMYQLLVEAKTFDVNLNWEADEYRWVEEGDLKKYELIPGVLKGLREIL